MHLKFGGRHLGFFYFRFGLPSFPIGFSGLLDSHYTSLVAVAVGLSYLSSLGAELLAFKVLRPPSWIIHFRFGCTITIPIGMLDPKIMGVAVGISLLSCLQAEIAWGVFLPPPG